MKVKELCKEFFKNLKEYVAYLMKVDFKELFVNTVILICILALATFVYLPVSLVDDLILSLLTIFIKFSATLAAIYHWIFKLISFVLSVLAFMYLFNMRFKDVKEKGLENKVEIKPKKDDAPKTELDLPKKKED